MNPRKKIYISVILFVAAIITLIGFVLLPLLSSIKKNSDNLLVQKENLASLRKEIEILNKTKSLYDGSKDNINRIDNLFCDFDNPRDLLDFLTKQPESYNIRNEIIKMSPVTTNQTDSWPSISFQVSSTGSFPDFIKFLHNLESGPYLVEISNITIKRITEGELGSENFKIFSLGDIKANLLMKVYSK